MRSVLRFMDPAPAKLPAKTNGAASAAPAPATEALPPAAHSCRTRPSAYLRRMWGGDLPRHCSPLKRLKPQGRKTYETVDACHRARWAFGAIIAGVGRRLSVAPDPRHRLTGRRRLERPVHARARRPARSGARHLDRGRG